ncbi:endonuclease/exonuclease/phosphatase family protein [Aliifodinibius salicampi]|uniref:Endonuclease/exonuclease/phosphatase family protein n=1 Tax=Fodinibius salicampi TaxID=1920655 RepID=A0ABT3PZR4_9BACT|nr:endonuclease/exonuclease/phosphatase family protein [Fodinibius salicampi]MCW9713321.1 endonuclease/exonuclease/phosphatase family protein [Fodinibius salicampi]
MMRALFLMVFSLLMSWTIAPAQDTLTVMSYNIYHGEQAYQAGKSNIQEVADLIRKVKPDLVALQEVDEMTGRLASLNEGERFSLVDSLAALTGMEGYFGKAIDYDGGGYGEGLLSKKSLTPQTVMLPIPKGGEKRTLLFTETRTKSGQPFIFAGTHLCHQYEENRIAQVRAINKYFLDTEVPVIIGGDFNFTPDTRTHRLMQDWWADTSLQFQKIPNLTFPSKKPDRRIDYLFLSRNANWEILYVKTIDVDYSDHLPVVARVVVHP